MTINDIDREIDRRIATAINQRDDAIRFRHKQEQDEAVGEIRALRKLATWIEKQVTAEAKA